MISFDRVKAGDTLYDVRKKRMGNTTMRRNYCWSVRVISINHAANSAIVSWNGNPGRTYGRRQIERLRKSPPKDKP